jgi:hypothetical protein
MEGEEAHKEETQEVQAPPEEVKAEAVLGSDNPELVQDNNPPEEQKIEEKTDNPDSVPEVPNPDKSEDQAIQENAPDVQPDQVAPETTENPEDKKSSYKNESEKSNMLQVHINLKDLNEPFKKSSMNFDIADSLMCKDALEKAKFKSFKQKFKANEASEMREAPQINKKSHKILIKKEETIKRKDQHKASIKYDKYDEKLHSAHPTQRLSAVLRLKECDPLNPVVMKASIEARKDFENLKKSEETKKKELIEKCKRAEYGSTTEAKPKALEKTVSKSTTDLAHKTSKSLIAATSLENLSSRVPPPNKQVLPAKSPVLPLDSVMISEKYSQLTPYSAKVKYNSGYNQGDIMTKARPMVDYKMQVFS